MRLRAIKQVGILYYAIKETDSAVIQTRGFMILVRSIIASSSSLSLRAERDWVKTVVHDYLLFFFSFFGKVQKGYRLLGVRLFTVDVGISRVTLMFLNRLLLSFYKQNQVEIISCMMRMFHTWHYLSDCYIINDKIKGTQTNYLKYEAAINLRLTMIFTFSIMTNAHASLSLCLIIYR